MHGVAVEEQDIAHLKGAGHPFAFNILRKGFYAPCTKRRRHRQNAELVGPCQNAQSAMALRAGSQRDPGGPDIRIALDVEKILMCGCGVFRCGRENDSGYVGWVKHDIAAKQTGHQVHDRLVVSQRMKRLEQLNAVVYWLMLLIAMDGCGTMGDGFEKVGARVDPAELKEDLSHVPASFQDVVPMDKPL